MRFLCTVGVVHKKSPGNLSQRSHFKNRIKSVSIATSDDIILPITMIFPSTKASRVRSNFELYKHHIPTDSPSDFGTDGTHFCRINFHRQWCAAPPRRSWRIEMLPMFYGEQSITPDSETCSLFAMEGVKRVSLTCNAPSIRAGNYFVATQTGSAYVRWDWTTLCVQQDVTGTQTPRRAQSQAKLPPLDRECFCLSPHLLPLATICQPQQLELKPTLASFFILRNGCWQWKKSKRKISCSFVSEGKVWQADGQMYMCFVF